MATKDCDCEAQNENLVNKIKNSMPEARIFQDVSDFFKTINDQTRVRILWALDENELCVCDLAVILNMTKSAVSHQLKSLKTAKLVKARKQGKHVFYSLDDEHVKTIFDMALEHINEID